MQGQTRRLVQSREDDRMLNGQDRVTAVDNALDQLTNPFDHMSVDQKKEMALFLFYRQLKVKIIVH